MPILPDRIAELLKSKDWSKTNPRLQHFLDQIDTGEPEEPRLPKIRSSRSRTGFRRTRNGKLVAPKQEQ